MRNLTLPHRQRGVLLLVLMMIFIVGSTGIFLASANSTGRSINEQQEVIYQMEQAKQALIAYALNYSSFGDVDGTGFTNDEGPTHLPCPDTDNDGDPDGTCESHEHGRLPEFTTLPSGDIYRFNDHYAGLDRQFWYVVSPNFSTGTSLSLNTSTAGTITLDGEDDIAAVIIAPGQALSSQNRPVGPTTASNYLEGDNASGSDFMNSYAADPENFNDLVIPIKASEFRAAMAMETTLIIKEWHDYVYDTWFSSYLGAWYGPYYYNFAWMIDQLSNANSDDLRYMLLDDWDSNYNYTKVSSTVSTITYTNCAITFTMTYGGGVTTDQADC